MPWRLVGDAANGGIVNVVGPNRGDEKTLVDSECFLSLTFYRDSKENQFDIIDHRNKYDGNAPTNDLQEYNSYLLK